MPAATRVLSDHLAPAGDIGAPSSDNEARLAREIDNVRVAIDWAFSPDGEPLTGIMLTAAYVPVWQRLTSLVECRERVERALDRLGREVDVSAPLRMSLQDRVWAGAAPLGGVDEEDRGDAGRGPRGGRGPGRRAGPARALWAIWTHHFNNGDNLAAQRVAERFSTVARGTGDPADLLIGDRLTGNTLHYAGRQPDAARLLRARDRVLRPAGRPAAREVVRLRPAAAGPRQAGPRPLAAGLPRPRQGHGAARAWMKRRRPVTSSRSALSWATPSVPWRS